MKILSSYAGTQNRIKCFSFVWKSAWGVWKQPSNTNTINRLTFLLTLDWFLHYWLIFHTEHWFSFVFPSESPSSDSVCMRVGLCACVSVVCWTCYILTTTVCKAVWGLRFGFKFGVRIGFSLSTEVSLDGLGLGMHYVYECPWKV